MKKAVSTIILFLGIFLWRDSAYALILTEDLIKEIKEMNRAEDKAKYRINDIAELMGGKKVDFGPNRGSQIKKKLNSIERRQKSKDMKLDQIKALSELNQKETDSIKKLKRIKNMAKLMKDLR